MVERHAVSYAPSLTVLLDLVGREPTDPTRDLLIFGDPEIGDRSTEVFRLSRDESFSALTGRMWVAVPWSVVVVGTTPIRSRDQEPTAFVAGDTLYVLHYVGEGSFNVWYRGVEVLTGPFWVEEGPGAARDMLSQEATREYWVEAETSAGQRGWVLAEEGLVARDNMRAPNTPSCPNRAL